MLKGRNGKKERIEIRKEEKPTEQKKSYRAFNFFQNGSKYKKTYLLVF